jgi:uncharacterized membrane protein
MTSSQDAAGEAAAGAPPRACSAAEMGAIAHLYRGEIYRSTVWRTRLDSTTNWAVVTTGIALSATFSSAQASPLPMALVGLIVTMFLLLEARRYRYFNIWRARARLLETDFFAPILRGDGVAMNAAWSQLLARDYCQPRYHVSLARAAIGPIPGQTVVIAGVLFHLGWMVFAYLTLRLDQRSWRVRQSLITMG